jgi:Xaa-Pro aminopeptidase
MTDSFPTLSLQERTRRWSRTRDLMKTHGVECLIVPGLKGREELEGYLSNDPAEGFVVFPLEGPPVVISWTGTRITRQMEEEARGRCAWIDDMRFGPYGPALVNVLTEKGLTQSRIGIVGIESKAPGEMEGFVPYKTWAHVLKELPGAYFLELSDAFVEMVLVKSEEELALMRHSAFIGEEACRRMLEVVKPGASERDLYRAITEVIFAHGGSPPAPFLILHSGPNNLGWGPPIWQHQGGHSRAFREGDLVQAEIFPRYAGLESQQQMSVHIEPVDPVHVECAAVARASYEAGLAALQPGINFKEVCDAMEEPLREAGCWHLTPLVHSLSPIAWVSGTGIGIEQAKGVESLGGRIRSRNVSGTRLLIKPGMVFELEPNACKGKRRVNIGGTVIVTEKGVEELNILATRMQIVIPFSSQRCNELPRG